MGKYEEALEQVRRYAEAGKISAEEILRRFPELKESEDEKARKRLIDICNFAIKTRTLADYTNEGFKECIAYLEKHKEQKPLMSDGEIEDRKRDIVAAIRSFYNEDYAKYLISFLKGLFPEDNAEDNYGQEMLAVAYNLMREYVPENLRTQDFWDSLKFMREYTGRVAVIHPYQKPAEWSEEDENYYDTIVRKLQVIGDDSGLTMNQIDFLDKNRPQRHWKPSEAQMEWLKSAVKLSTDKPHIHGIIISLYEQLKRL